MLTMIPVLRLDPFGLKGGCAWNDHRGWGGQRRHWMGEVRGKAAPWSRKGSGGLNLAVAAVEMENAALLSKRGAI
jgi:hypothetical protein